MIDRELNTYDVAIPHMEQAVSRSTEKFAMALRKINFNLTLSSFSWRSRDLISFRLANSILSPFINRIVYEVLY
jgi:hypothetical protein